MKQRLGNLVGRIGDLRVGVQQVLETLKLVQYDQVRLEALDADIREHAPQLAENPVLACAQLRGMMLALLAEPRVDDLFDLGP